MRSRLSASAGKLRNLLYLALSYGMIFAKIVMWMCNPHPDFIVSHALENGSVYFRDTFAIGDIQSYGNNERQRFASRMKLSLTIKVCELIYQLAECNLVNRVRL